MTDYGVTAEVVRLTMIAGVILSMLLYERLQLTTGGAIVPAYFALGIYRPIAVVITLLIGYLTYLLVNRIIGKRAIIYGRRKFEIEVLIGVALILGTTLLAGALGQLDQRWLELAGIGFMVPGMVAHDMGRQKPGRTLGVVAVTMALLVVVMVTLQSLVSILPGADLADALSLAAVVGYPRELLLLAVAASIGVGMLVFKKLGLRSGGYITGAYLALISPRWLDLVFTALVALVTWFVTTQLLMPRLLIFGRRKLSTMLLVGSAIGWLGELLALAISHGDYLPWRGLTVATFMVPALLANDAQRQGIEKTVWGTTLTSLGVFALASLAGALSYAVGWL